MRQLRLAFTFEEQQLHDHAQGSESDDGACLAKGRFASAPDEPLIPRALERFSGAAARFFNRPTDRESLVSDLFPFFRFTLPQI